MIMEMKVKTTSKIPRAKNSTPGKVKRGLGPRMKEHRYTV